METLILVVHVLVAIAMTALILLQQGKGAEMGASFGGGSSQTVFGAAGAASFLTRFTAVLAAIFFMTSLTLAYMASQRPVSAGGSVMDSVKTETVVPAAPVQQDIQDDSKAKSIPK